jgi:dTDP-D-glucose 4,6-dehydratase
VLGYTPLVPFEEGLRRTWEWYRNAYESNRNSMVFDCPSTKAAGA